MRKLGMSIERILRSSPRVQDAAPEIMALTCRRFRWCLSECWLPDPTRKHLTLTFSWHRPDARLEEFESTSRGMVFEKGGGLCGRAWQAGAAVWIESLAPSSEFARASLADRAGLKSGVAVPAFDGSRIVAAFCFYSRSIEPRSDRVLEFLEAVAGRIGKAHGAASTPRSPTSSSRARAARA